MAISKWSVCIFNDIGISFEVSRVFTPFLRVGVNLDWLVIFSETQGRIFLRHW